MFDVNEIRNDFPMVVNGHKRCVCYFDSAATSFKPRRVIDRVSEYYCYENSNIVFLQ